MAEDVNDGIARDDLNWLATVIVLVSIALIATAWLI